MAAAEQKKSYAVVKNFTTLNTKAYRTAIKEEEFSWIENAMPIGHSNIKIVPAQKIIQDGGSNVSFSNTVTVLASANIDVNDYVLAFEDNGKAQYVKLVSSDTGNVGVIANAGTFSNTGVTIAQYKNERVMIGDPTKGLSSWDAANVIAIGSVGVIGLKSPGNGYLTAPAVSISAPSTANGIQATAVATISTGAGGVQSIAINTPGSGYTSVPTVTIGPPDVSYGTQATAGATISGGNVVAISIFVAGSGYTSVPSVTISGGGGSSANATATLATGLVNSITITNAGSGYTSPPTVTISGGSGSGANAIAGITTFAQGAVSVLVTNGGSGYGSTPNVSITGGGGSNANGIAILSGGQVTQVVMDNVGTGYTSAPSVSFSGGSANVAATAIGVANLDKIVDVAVFSGRVWVAAGRTVYYSAAGSYSDFTSVSAGSINLTDSTLHGNIQGLLSANNFLYIFGDDSINVFSDLRVDTTGHTLFTNTNVSASVGTKRIYAVFPYFRSVLFMNDYGIYALVGSTTSKISDQLDGVFPYIDFSQPVSGGQVLLNNILCASFSFTYNGPYGGPRVIQAVFFEKKWFITSQGTLTYLTSAPFSGLINLYGVADKDLYRLYADTTANVASKIQTALMPMGDPIRTKQALKFGVEAILPTAGQFNITVDSEQGSSPVYVSTGSESDITWYNNVGTTISWTNFVSTQIAWGKTTTGYFLYKSDAQQYGKYLGLTMTSNSAGFIVNTFEFEHELRVRF